MIVPRNAPSNAGVAAHYDDLDPYYRDIWGEHVHHGLWDSGRESPAEATRRLVDLVADRAQVQADQRVCDVGCGYGGTARVLARDLGAEVTAITLSPAQHAFARALEPDATNPLYLLGDWLANDLPADHFDAVVAIESTEHMADPPAFFAEAARVLRPGGRLVVCAWLARPSPWRWEERLVLEPICREGRLFWLGEADDYRRLAAASGLLTGAVEDLSRRVKRTWPICVGRGLKALLRDRSYRRFLLRSRSPDRIFALTMLRIWLAYELGSLRYGVLTATKPGGSP